MRSSSATCFETAGWLMRSSAAAAENDLRRANAANARKRASSSITLAYANRPIMYFFSSSSLGKVPPIVEAKGDATNMDRRGFLGGVLGFVATANAATPASQMSSGPLVWPIAAKLQTEIRSFDGHTDTVLDVIGRIGSPASLVIFTEGNHLMVLSSSDIVGAFMSWAKSHPQYADLDL